MKGGGGGGFSQDSSSNAHDKFKMANTQVSGFYHDTGQISA